MESEGRIVDLLVEKYGVDRSRISPEATMTDLGLDSLSVAELVFDIEDLFGIEIGVGEANFETFGQAVALVDRCIQAKSA